ncbi:LuxR C-terminal-related transcriptional regulator [Adlercreutzia sp. R25]|uniref:LuxR C-terminal-related transcriptional regulator n=1 Tax=Adlercreutzia shanghongiae TaxID=3111773 RepID=A0ABU6IXN5_9ACTN|nr:MULTISPECIES: LuxR C-terminal-related transcriptional regulator [unclassified Adlercreutzia]MEC4272497.1 LuxR C-terminal-related transcriptional regulator [Adlercreutzia sp. R25]MEC4294603.1 LuxR C-terminal-related transcriptional regulator [Adlercreutzia sp. R22]
MGKDEMSRREGRPPAVLRDFDVSYIGVCVPQIWIYCIAHRADGVLGEVALGVPLYLALSAAMAVALALALRGALPARRRPIDWVLAVVQGIATAVLVMPPGTFELLAGSSLYVASAAAAGIGVAWLYLQWAPFFATLGAKDVIACVFIAMAVGSALKVPLDMLPAPFAAVLLALMPLLSVALVRRADARPVPCERPPRMFHEVNPTAVPWKILFGVAVYSFAIGVVKGVPVEADPVPFAALTAVHHGVEILLALAMLWWVLVCGRMLNFSGLWRAVLLFTAATLFFLPVAGPAATPWLLLGANIAQTLVVMLLWAMLADVAHHSTASPAVIFASGWIAYSLPLALGEVAGLLVGHMDSPTVAVAALAYLVTVTVVLALNDTAFSQRRIFADLDVPLPAPTAFESLDDGCDRLGREHGLTAREIEVLQMLVKGRSKSYIAETLFISENTVRSHSKHIYQKLDVHSKQEILDLLGLHN